MQQRMPAIFLNHGGGPLPLLGDAAHTNLTRFLSSFSKTVGSPTTILVASAHWETDVCTFVGSEDPGLLYDYYGFPPASYDIKYPARNNTELVNKARELLKGQGFSSKIDMKRAFDHGVFVPLKLMFPNADIPVVQISLPRSRDPQVAYQMGLALKPLRDEGVLIIGSGLSFHNLEAFFSSDRSKLSRSQRFDTGLQEIMGDSIDRQRRLVAWEQLPEARYCHPAEDHLIPLIFTAGVGDGDACRVDFEDTLMGAKITGFRFS